MLDAHNKWILGLVTSVVLLGGISLGAGSGIKLEGFGTLGIVGALMLAAAIALLAVIVFSSKPSEETLDQRRASTSPALDKSENKILVALVVLGVLVVGGTFVWVGLEIKLQVAGPELTLPLVVIIGVVVLLVTLALVGVTFSVLNMSDRAQALALPEGSVRAVIALMLLLVFAITAIFVYSNVAGSGKVTRAENLTTEDVIGLRQHATVIFTQPKFIEPPAAAPAGQTYTAYYRDFGSAAGDDIAKQLIVLLGTLVTAVASFYFGSSSVSSAHAAADRARFGVGGPNASSVNPPALKADGSSQALEITGANLGNVNAVKLVSADGKTSIAAVAGSVKASPTNVTCNVIVLRTTPPGSYDVVVSDNANNSSAVPKGVEINPAVASPAASPSAPIVTAVSPNSAAPGGDLKPFTITGTNLGKTSKVTLELAGETSIAAVNVVPQGEDKVVCDVTIPPGTKLEKWDVVVSDGTTSTKLPQGLQIA